MVDMMRLTLVHTLHLSLVDMHGGISHGIFKLAQVDWISRSISVLFVKILDLRSMT